MSTPPSPRGIRDPVIHLLVVVPGADEHPVARLGGVHRVLDRRELPGDAVPGADPQDLRTAAVAARVMGMSANADSNAATAMTGSSRRPLRPIVMNLPLGR